MRQARDASAAAELPRRQRCTRGVVEMNSASLASPDRCVKRRASTTYGVRLCLLRLTARKSLIMLDSRVRTSVIMSTN